jgi:hypothetical protein
VGFGNVMCWRLYSGQTPSQGTVRLVSREGEVGQDRRS